jgi:hypothetical protein
MNMNDILRTSTPLHPHLLWCPHLAAAAAAAGVTCCATPQLHLQEPQFQQLLLLMLLPHLWLCPTCGQWQTKYVKNDACKVACAQ